MKLVVIKSHLKDAIGIVSGASAENANLPVLKNILIEAKSGKITLAATNLELALEYTILGKVLEPGRATIPAGMLAGIINNLQTERLNLEEKNNSLDIKTDNYHAALQGISADEFPLIPKVKNPKGALVIKASFLRDALAQVVFAAQPSELRPELGSVLFVYTIDSLKLVATDSFRLAEKTIPKQEFSSTQKEEFRILVPLKTAQELVRAFRDDEDVTISHDESQISFSTQTISLVSRLLDGRFPDYEAIIPKKFSGEISVPKEEFISAIKLSGALGTRAGEIKIAIHENKKSIIISCVEQGVGENTYALPARVHGEIHEASFNWRYLLDGARAIAGEEAWIGIVDDNKPALLKAPNNGGYFYVVMPILKA